YALFLRIVMGGCLSLGRQSSDDRHPPADPALVPPSPIERTGTASEAATKAPSSYLIQPGSDEAERLRQRHFTIRWALDCNFHPPIDELLNRGISVLDVGCGSAQWLLDMAEVYQTSQFYGIDIVDRFPNIHSSNLHFTVGDVRQGLPYSDDTFEFVNQSLMVMAFTDQDWTALMKELRRVCKPGAWVELMEEGLFSWSEVERHLEENSLAMDQHGYRTHVALSLGKTLAEAGAHTITTGFVSIPLNWGGTFGDLAMANFLRFLDLWQPWLRSIRGITAEAYKAELDVVQEESRMYNVYLNLHYAYGQVVKDASINA
ncbi:hypothetical protein BZG36_05472, partial [Bifiguratus adelaidae]